MKNKSVNIFQANNIFKGISPITKIDGKWIPSRPIGHSGLFHRIKCAWEVFQGRADIIKWYKQ